MSFKSKRIRPKGPKKKFEIKNKSKIIAGLGSVFIIVFLLFSIYKAISSFSFNWAFSLFSESLPTDSFGHTNFLLLGTGGKNHDGPDLTDTIIVAGLDEKSGNLSLLSIPRDLYIKDNNFVGSRVNQVYSYFLANGMESKEALKNTVKRVENLVGMPIHYYGKVNFEALVDIIDTLGGIDVYVDETINDPLYPKDGTIGYEPFYIERGIHKLDGETALKYARSRHTSSDFSRSERQQKIIFAIKEKALSAGILSSIGKIDEILETLGKNIETNISAQEILYLGSIAQKFSRDKFHTHVIHDDPSRCGGFLYTPEQRFYGGAFVLVPAGGQSNLNKYTELLFTHPGLLAQKNKLQVLNGTKTGLLAGKTKVLLSRHCFDVIRYGNARNQQVEKTTYYIKNSNIETYQGSELEQYISFLQSLIPGEVSFNIPNEYLQTPYASDANIILEIGNDYIDKEWKDPFDYLTDRQITSQNDEDETTDEETNDL